MNNLAYLLMETEQNLNEALHLAQMAKEQDPKSPAIMDTLGMVYLKKGLYNSAISQLQYSQEKEPGNAEIHYHLGLAYHKYGATTKARNMLKKASMNSTQELVYDALKQGWL